jgi:hypothetical protein
MMRIFSWLPTKVRVWGSNEQEDIIIWLRYYYATENKFKVSSVDGKILMSGAKYILKKRRKSLLE